MNADYCPACQQPAGVCSMCGKAAQLHEHVSGEWYCTQCWHAFPQLLARTDQDCDAYAVVPMSSGSGGR